MTGALPRFTPAVRSELGSKIDDDGRNNSTASILPAFVVATRKPPAKDTILSKLKFKRTKPEAAPTPMVGEASMTTVSSSAVAQASGSLINEDAALPTFKIMAEDRSAPAEEDKGHTWSNPDSSWGHRDDDETRKRQRGEGYSEAGGGRWLQVGEPEMSEGGYGAQHEWGGERVDGPMNQGHAGQQDESHSSRIDAGGWGTPAMDSRQSCRPVKEEGDWDNGVEKPGRLVDERTSRQRHGWSNNEPSHDPWIGPDVDKNHGAHMHRRDESSRPMDRDIPQHHHGKNDYYRGPSNGSGGQRNGYDSRRSHVRDDYSDGPSNGRGGGQRNGYSSHRSHGGDYYSDRPSNGRGFDSHHSGYDSRRPMEDTRRNDQDHAPSHASNSQWSAVQGGRGNAVIIEDDERHQAKDGRYEYHYRSSNRQDFDGRRGGYNSQNSQFSQRPVKQEHQDNGVVDELSHPRDGRGEDFYRQSNGRGYAGHRGGEDSHRPQWSGEPVRNEIRDDNGLPKGPRSNNHRSGYKLPLYTTEGMEHPGRGWHSRGRGRGRGSNRGIPNTASRGGGGMNHAYGVAKSQRYQGVTHYQPDHTRNGYFDRPPRMQDSSMQHGGLAFPALLDTRFPDSASSPAIVPWSLGTDKPIWEQRPVKEEDAPELSPGINKPGSHGKEDAVLLGPGSKNERGGRRGRPQTRQGSTMQLESPESAAGAGWGACDPPAVSQQSRSPVTVGSQQAIPTTSVVPEDQEGKVVSQPDVGRKEFEEISPTQRPKSTAVSAVNPAAPAVDVEQSEEPAKKRRRRVKPSSAAARLEGRRRSGRLVGISKSKADAVSPLFVDDQQPQVSESVEGQVSDERNEPRSNEAFDGSMTRQHPDTPVSVPPTAAPPLKTAPTPAMNVQQPPEQGNSESRHAVSSPDGFSSKKRKTAALSKPDARKEEYHGGPMTRQQWTALSGSKAMPDASSVSAPVDTQRSRKLLNPRSQPELPSPGDCVPIIPSKRPKKNDPKGTPNAKRSRVAGLVVEHATSNSTSVAKKGKIRAAKAAAFLKLETKREMVDGIDETVVQGECIDGAASKAPVKGRRGRKPKGTVTAKLDCGPDELPLEKSLDNVITDTVSTNSPEQKTRKRKAKDPDEPPKKRGRPAKVKAGEGLDKETKREEIGDLENSITDVPLNRPDRAPGSKAENDAQKDAKMDETAPAVDAEMLPVDEVSTVKPDDLVETMRKGTRKAKSAAQLAVNIEPGAPGEYSVSASPVKGRGKGGRKPKNPVTAEDGGVVSTPVATKRKPGRKPKKVEPDPAVSLPSAGPKPKNNAEPDDVILPGQPRWTLVPTKPVKKSKVVPEPLSAKAKGKMKASYVQPRVWCSSREELATILPEFSSSKLVNGISWDLSETPVMLLAEDIPISASNPRGTKNELDITLYRDFVCVEEDLDHEINEYTKRPRVMEDAPSFIPSDFSDPGPSRGRRSSAILDPVSPTSNIPTSPDLHTMNMLLSDAVTPGARNTHGHRSLSEPPEILVNCVENTNMDTDTRHPSNIHTGEQPCSPLPTESSLNDALSPESISARRPRSKDEIDDTIIHCAEYLSVDCDVPRRCPDVSTCPHSARRSRSEDRAATPPPSSQNAGASSSIPTDVGVSTNNCSCSRFRFDPSCRCNFGLRPTQSDVTEDRSKEEDSTSADTEKPPRAPEVRKEGSSLTVNAKMHPPAPAVGARASSAPPTLGSEKIAPQPPSPELEMSLIQDISVPSTLPDELQVLCNLFSESIPLTVVSSRAKFMELWGIWIPEEYAYVYLGYFEIIKLLERRVDVPSTASPVPGLVSGRAEWTFQLKWGDGGEHTIFSENKDKLDLGHPWWLPPLYSEGDSSSLSSDGFEPGISFGRTGYNILPLSLLAEFGYTTPDNYFPRGWHCSKCGKLNFQEHLRHRKCTSSQCFDNEPLPEGYVLHLATVRAYSPNLPLTLPVNVYPKTTMDGDYCEWGDGMVTVSYFPIAQPDSHPDMIHIFTGNMPKLQVDASRMLVEFQRDVPLYRSLGDSKPYFTYEVGPDGWDDVPDVVTSAREVMTQRAMTYGEIDKLSIDRLRVWGWVTRGSRRGDEFIRAKKHPVLIMCLGCDVAFTVVPVTPMPIPNMGLSRVAPKSTISKSVQGEMFVASSQAAPIPVSSELQENGLYTMDVKDGDVTMDMGPGTDRLPVEAPQHARDGVEGISLSEPMLLLSLSGQVTPITTTPDENQGDMSAPIPTASELPVSLGQEGYTMDVLEEDEALMEVEPGEVLLAEERADVAMKEELNEDGATETLQQRAADPGEDPKEEIVPNGEVGMDGESDMVLQAVEALLGMAGGALERPADAPAAIHPTAARAPGRRKTKAQAAGETVVFSMVHGDVIVLSGDDFQFSIKRSGTSILLIGSQDEGRE